MTASVDLVVNCYERTWQRVLAPGFFPDIVDQNRFAFARRVALLNNIADWRAATAVAEARLREREIDAYYLVADYMEEALRRTGLTAADLASIPHYSSWALAALVLPGSDWLMHWDADLQMDPPCDWVGPALELMQSDSRIAVANPMWKKADMRRELREICGDFVLGYGFTDQIYLLRRSEFAAPVYRYWVPISMRYPLSHVRPYYEQMVDAYMRRNRRLRATLAKAHFTHMTEEGAAYPGGFGNRIRRYCSKAAVWSMRMIPGRHPYVHD
jgi:hypothetical protein